MIWDKREGVKLAVEVAKNRLKILDDKLLALKNITKAETYERQMILDLINRGEEILNEKAKV